MAKNNFDFDTESKGKLNLEFGFLKNLTQKQKEMILMIAIGVVALIIIVVIGVVMIAGNGGNSGNNGGGNAGGDISDNGNGENGDGTGDSGNDTENGQMPDAITEMYISSVPTKLVYFENENPDFSGLTVKVKSEGTYTVSYDVDPDAFIITGFDSSTPVEEQTITVECRGLTDTFIITIKEIEIETPKLTGIEFFTYPQQIFDKNDLFDIEGSVLLCTYSDGNTVEIPLLLSYLYGLENVFDMSGKYILLPGEHTITVEYGENGVFVQTQYTITVN